MTKGKIFSLLFALPFFGVGVWMAYSISANLIDASVMKQWEPVQAMLQRAGYERHPGDDSDTYEAYAQYTYEYGGEIHTGTRVAISGGADNIGDYQTNLGNRLSQAMNRGKTVTVYVNPDNPEAAIVDRSVRWGLLGFKSIFLFVFGGIGLGLIIFILRAPKEKDLNSPEFQNKPWLANDGWQTPSIKSSSKNSMYFSWGFAAVWNLISAPLPFVIFSEVTDKANMLALVGLLFPLIGIWLIAWAGLRTAEWRRFGAAPVRMDPFPGSIGGHVGGTIDVNLPFDSAAQFSITLTSIHSYMSGSGKERSRRESAKWQDSQVAHVNSGPAGSRLSFRFDVPEDLSESAADKREDSYHLWRLNVVAELDGVNFDRDYEIPVYQTATQSASLSEVSIREAKSAQEQINVGEIEQLVNLTHTANGMSLHFPMGRNLGLGFGAALFGGIFVAAGWMLTVHAGHWFMGAIFGAVGGLIFLSGLYFFFNSLDVFQEGGSIRSVRRILGVKVKERTMRVTDFDRFNKKSTSTTRHGSKHVMRYSVAAIDRSGYEMTVGEGFKGAGQAEAAAKFIGRTFGLREQRREASVDGTVNDDNFLAAS